jgi:type IV pilus assembly protein PilB
MSGVHDKIKYQLKERALAGPKADPVQIEELYAQASFARFRRDILEKEYVTEDEYLQIVASVLGVPFFDVEKVRLSREEIEQFPEDLAYRYKVFPVAQTEHAITLAITDPLNLILIDDLKLRLKKEIDMVIAPEGKIVELLDKVYKSHEDFFDKIEESAEDTVPVEEGQDLTLGYDALKESEKAPIVKVVDLILTESLNRRASDIHIEPEEDCVRVRYRVDGVMYISHTLPKKNQNAILSRLKIMSGLNITENRVPQDGRFKIRMGKKEVDYRVSSLPTRYGEKFVLRALDKGNLSVGLEKSGFSEVPLALFQKALERPFGIMLITGPTGSGKSTTLYSVLNFLNTPERHIITIEDPVEYQVDGLTQIPINHEINMTFASALRAVLRQSPDVVMVGEIRDAETAEIAIKASLTGQFILSTLHTNDSIGAITRLADMGVEPFLLSSSLVMTSAQRLCRKICPKCKEPQEVPEHLRQKLGLDPDTVVYHGRGCDACGNSGYKGREAVLEVLLLDDELKDMIVKRASEGQIAAYARKNLQFRTLREDVMEKCLRGVTTVEEVFRIT